MMSMIRIRRGFTVLFSRKNPFFFLRDCEPRSSLPIYLSTCTTTTNNLPQNNTNFSEDLIGKYDFHPQLASRLASAKNTKNSDTILSFFIENGFSPAQLEQILTSWPGLLSLRLETTKPKIKIFRDFGFSSDEIGEIISKEPSILHASADKSLVPSLSVLKDLFGSAAKVADFLKKASGRYVRSDLSRSLVPNIDLLSSCGVDKERIVWLMHYVPRLMLQKPENMKRSVEKADQLGADRSTKMYVHCVRIIGSMKNEIWELKKKAFRDVGFSEDDILRAFRKGPPAFLVSEEKIKKVAEVVLATGKYDVSCLVRSPTSLCRSIEKRYKPRIEVLRVLEDKKLITQWPAFWVLFDSPEKNFFAKFVKPYYDEVGEVYMSMISLPVGKREVNPGIPKSRRKELTPGLYSKREK